MNKGVILAILMFPSLAAIALADNGLASYYNLLNKPLSCSNIVDTLNDRIISVNDELWDNGKACGKTYSVRCIDAYRNGLPNPCFWEFKRVNVTVGDHISQSLGVAMLLSKFMYEVLADLSGAIIKIDYYKIEDN